MAFVQLMGYNPVLQPGLCLLDWLGLVRLALGIALRAGITLLGLIWLGIALLGLVGLALLGIPLLELMYLHLGLALEIILLGFGLLELPLGIALL